MTTPMDRIAGVRMAPPITGDDYVAPASLPLGPGTVTWKLGPMGFLGSSRALLLQTTHPKVAAGVAQHSDYRSDPFGRAFRTFDTVLKLVFASDPEVSRRQSSRMDKRHRPVTGTTASGDSYDARDPQLGLWVWATLTDTTLVAYERVHGRLHPRDRERFYEEQKLFGIGCNIPADLLPPTLEDFEAYVERVVATELEVTPEGRDVAHFTFHPEVPRGLAPVIGWAMRVTAAHMFPPRVREMYELPWSRASARRFDAAMRVLAVVDRLLPDPVRMLGIRLAADHDLLARLERRSVQRRAARNRADRRAA
jgi:uncharacterized protein (DUF2236 family)